MYPTQSDDPPQAEVPPGGINSANYDGVFGSRATFVGSYTNAPSPYGTFDQAGNVFEWTDTAFMGGRGSHGGYFGTRVSNLEALSSSHTSFVYPLDYNGGTGFRIAMIPEPTTIGLLIAATMGLLAIRRQGSRQAMGHVAR